MKLLNDTDLSADFDPDDEPIDSNEKCHGCPRNTPEMCPYENDGNGKCPTEDKT